MGDAEMPSTFEVRAPSAATVVALPHPVGAVVDAGTVLAVLEVMKMEHPQRAPERRALHQLRAAPSTRAEARARRSAPLGLRR